jgi:hemoglobin/transferrin/lactoferrin receptor protein
MACCWAIDGAAQPPASQLAPFEVIGIAHRIERSLDDAAPGTSLIMRTDIERGVVSDLRELLRYEPGVNIERSTSRFGLGDIGIRGMTGNRVLMQVDGIRLPDSYRVGRFSNASRNQLDTGLLQRVEILRGPGSALYGSDALGGVVAFSTVDPDDVLGGGHLAAGADAGYASAAERPWQGLLLATDAKPLQALLGVQHSDWRETASEGTNDVVGTARTSADPQQGSSLSLLTKVLWQGGAAGRWRLTLERHEQDVHTDILSLNPQSARTVSLRGDDSLERRRASLDVDMADVGGLSRLRALIHVQRALTLDSTSDVRANTTAVCLSAPGTLRCRRDVRFRFEQNESGISWLGEADGVGHWLFGLELARIRYEESRDGLQTNLDTGAVSNVVGGEAMPTRDFPLSESNRIGAFVQNEYAANPRLLLTPALRFDRVRLNASADQIFVAANPGRPVVDKSDQAVSPRLGLLYRLLPSTVVTAQWAAGFRAPPASDVNLGLSSLPAGYAVIPNPDLRSETSRGGEIGVRGRHPDFDYTATAFITYYRDLIVSRAALPCPADPRCVPGAAGTFQSQNVSRARIHGFEASARYRLGRSWSFRASAAYAFGADTGRGRPLNSVDPLRFVVVGAYDVADFSARLNVTHARAKTHIDQSSGTLFATPDYTVVDLTASWQLGARLQLSAGVFNLFDHKYWLWSDVRGITNPGATVDRYSQPGRNFSVLLRARL